MDKNLYKQKRFIIENRDVLTLKNKQDILRIISTSSPSLINEKECGGVSINLDNLKDDIVQSIYNITKKRRDFMNSPVCLDSCSEIADILRCET